MQMQSTLQSLVLKHQFHKHLLALKHSGTMWACCYDQFSYSQPHFSLVLYLQVPDIRYFLYLLNFSK